MNPVILNSSELPKGLKLINDPLERVKSLYFWLPGVNRWEIIYGKFCSIGKKIQTTDL
jgi:hypothetical protein